MNLGNDPADQVVRFTLEGTEVVLKLSGLAAKNFAMFAYAVLRDQKKTRGKTRLVRMLKEQRPFKFFQIPVQFRKEFAKEARRHGLLYVPIRNKRNRSELELVVFADEAAKVNRILDNLNLDFVRSQAGEAAVEHPEETGGRAPDLVPPAPVRNEAVSIGNEQVEFELGGFDEAFSLAYRLRSLLGYVGLEDLVVYANGIFSFNPEIKVVTDVGLFEELCDSIEMENNPKKRYRLYEAAVGLYSGNLLPRLSDNIYFIPSITYYQGLYFRLAGRYIERQTECGEYVYAHKAAKAALAFDPFNSSLNMHLTILLYQQSGAGTANAFYTGIKRHLTEAHIQRIKQTCPNMII